jgi:hypothetical protein
LFAGNGGGGGSASGGTNRLAEAPVNEPHPPYAVTKEPASLSDLFDSAPDIIPSIEPTVGRAAIGGVSFSALSVHPQSPPRGVLAEALGSPLAKTSTCNLARMVNASLDRPAPASMPAPSVAIRPPFGEATSNNANGGLSKRATEAMPMTTPTKKAPAGGTPRSTPGGMSPVRARATRNKPSATSPKPNASLPRWR